MTEVDISQIELDLIKKYVNERWNTFLAKGRSPRAIAKSVLLGKIGEVAFAKMHDIDINIPLQTTCSDPGWDFIVDDIKYDVKTLNDLKSRRVYFNKNYMRSDFYAIMLYNKRKVKFVGYVSKEDALANCKCDRYSTYFGLNPNYVKRNIKGAI